jgi:hypothetical protein
MKIVLPLALTIAACAPMPPLAESTGPCAVGEIVRGRFIGTKFRMAMRGEIQGDANAKVARVLRPGDAATMDVNPDRLDILVDDMGRIEGLRCG